jgi:murein DD-endopeptidase MepM/ murein hydrolase activator NlpD
MRPPLRLLVVCGDGSRVVRFGLPRWIAYGAAALVTATLGGLAGLSGEYLFLKRQQGEVVALRQRVGNQREIISAFQKRVASVRSDITAWRSLHADMWEALGPQAGSDQQASGIGGVTAPPPAAPASGPRPLLELDRLAHSVAEESPRLRELTETIGRVGKLMSALPLRWPIRGAVNSEYGPRRSPWSGRAEHHGGLDIGAPAGTPVKSPAAGKVILASSGGDFGKHIKLDHGNGLRSLYGHLSQLDVKAGQRVEKGQVIGSVGSTGRSTGPHLHYEIRVDGKPVNPRKFLWER